MRPCEGARIPERIGAARPPATVAPDMPPFRAHQQGEGPMSDRLIGGGIAAVAAVLTLVQLLWLFGLFSPADALAGRTGFIYAGLHAAWFCGTFAMLAAAAVILLMATDDETHG